MYALRSWAKPSLALAKATKSGLSRGARRDGIRGETKNKQKLAAREMAPTQTGNPPWLLEQCYLVLGEKRGKIK